jgi:ParB-like chromosome segregation protein Spo0J
MIEESAHLVRWMPLIAAIAFILGEAYADLRRRRKHLRELTEELQERLQQASLDMKPIQRALKEQRAVINDTHRRLLAVSKGLEKRPS